VAQFLLIRGATIDATCVGDGKTALHMACSLLTSWCFRGLVVRFCVTFLRKVTEKCESPRKGRRQGCTTFWFLLLLPRN
jgi:hypothetical protein